MQLFHLSENSLHGKFLYPRVPNNYMTKNGFEEGTTPRVSFSTTIDGALIAMSANLKGKTFYVHEPMRTNPKIVSNAAIVHNKFVPDAHLTGEVWVIEPVQLRLVQVIKVIDAIDEPLQYTYGDGHKAELYKWKYRKESSMIHHIGG